MDHGTQDSSDQPIRNPTIREKQDALAKRIAPNRALCKEANRTLEHEPKPRTVQSTSPDRGMGQMVLNKEKKKLFTDNDAHIPAGAPDNGQVRSERQKYHQS